MDMSLEGPAVSDTKYPKLLVKRPRGINTDSRYRSGLADAVDTAELELVSTQMLKVMLTSKNEQDRKAIESAAAGRTDGVLVRNPGSGSYEIIGDDELQEILAANDNLPKISRPADATLGPLKDYPDDEQLSLVTTQALRRVLDGGTGEESAADEEEPIVDAGGGFNPYDHS